MPKPRKRKRIILGVGYPWYGNDDTQPSMSRTVKLCAARHGNGQVLPLNIKDSGAWKKYKLILEEV